MELVLLPVLYKNDSYEDIISKLDEEVEELKAAIMRYRITGSKEDLIALTGESFDVSQVMVGLFDKLKQEENINIGKESQKHLVKLMNRKWIMKDFIRLEKY